MHINIRKVVTGVLALAATAAFSLGVSSEAWGGGKGSAWDSKGSAWDAKGSAWD